MHVYLKFGKIRIQGAKKTTKPFNSSCRTKMDAGASRAAFPRLARGNDPHAPASPDVHAFPSAMPPAQGYFDEHREEKSRYRLRFLTAFEIDRPASAIFCAAHRASLD